MHAFMVWKQRCGGNSPRYPVQGRAATGTIVSRANHIDIDDCCVICLKRFSVLRNGSGRAIHSTGNGGYTVCPTAVCVLGWLSSGRQAVMYYAWQGWVHHTTPRITAKKSESTLEPGVRPHVDDGNPEWVSAHGRVIIHCVMHD